MLRGDGQRLRAALPGMRGIPQRDLRKDLAQNEVAQCHGAFRQAGQRERQQHNRQERSKPFLHKIQSSYIWWSLPGYQALT